MKRVPKSRDKITASLYGVRHLSNAALRVTLIGADRQRIRNRDRAGGGQASGILRGRIKEHVSDFFIKGVKLFLFVRKIITTKLASGGRDGADGDIARGKFDRVGDGLLHAVFELRHIVPINASEGVPGTHGDGEIKSSADVHAGFAVVFAIIGLAVGAPNVVMAGVDSQHKNVIAAADVRFVVVKRGWCALAVGATVACALSYRSGRSVSARVDGFFVIGTIIA